MRQWSVAPCPGTVITRRTHVWSADVFERFTESTRRALFFSRAACSDHGRDLIDANDLLHGILLAAPEAVLRFASTSNALQPVETGDEFESRSAR